MDSNSLKDLRTQLLQLLRDCLRLETRVARMKLDQLPNDIFLRLLVMRELLKLLDTDVPFPVTIGQVLDLQLQATSKRVSRLRTNPEFEDQDRA